MKILVVSRGYPTENYRMNGIFEFDQAKALAEAGHDVVLASLDMRSIRRWRKWGLSSKVIDGINVEELNVPVGPGPKNILEKIREKSFELLYKKIVKKHGSPDIVHAHFLFNGFAATKVVKNKQVPIVLTEHLSAMNQDELPDYLNTLAKETYPKVDQLVTVSSLLSDSIKKKFNVESLVVPNIVDASSFNYKDTLKKDDKFTFVSTGGLIKRKGMDLLIKAFYDAFKDNKDIRLYIYGEGPERTNLENQINELKLEQQIYLMGLKPRHEIAAQMHLSNCFVLPSKLETFGVAYIEAMATGLPVIATRCGGPEDFVNENNGILIPIDNHETLTNALKDIKSNYNTYDSKEIAREITEKYSSDVVIEQLEEIYSKLIL